MNGAPWTPEQLELLRRLYPGTPTRDVAKACGHCLGSTYKHANTLGLKKSAAFLASPASGRLEHHLYRGEKTRFKKGQVPANKGLRRPGWHRGRMRETQFKKGVRPHTWRPLGHERMCDGYLQRKVQDTGYTPDDYRPVHRLMWEEAHGPIPPGQVVVFKDGNRKHIALDNLELITRQELQRRNHWKNRYPADVVGAIVARIALKRAITMRLKREEQDQ